MDEKITTEVLYSAFIPFGEVRNVQIPVDPKTGKIRGFGFVEFAEIDDAQEAKENMNSMVIFCLLLQRFTYFSLSIFLFCFYELLCLFLFCIDAELFGRVLRVTVSKPTKIRLEGQEAGMFIEFSQLLLNLLIGWVEVDTMNPIESDESEEEEEDKNEKKEE